MIPPKNPHQLQKEVNRRKLIELNKIRLIRVAALQALEHGIINEDRYLEIIDCLEVEEMKIRKQIETFSQLTDAALSKISGT